MTWMLPMTTGRRRAKAKIWRTKFYGGLRSPVFVLGDAERFAPRLHLKFSIPGDAIVMVLTTPVGIHRVVICLGIGTMAGRCFDIAAKRRNLGRCGLAQTVHDPSALAFLGEPD